MAQEPKNRMTEQRRVILDAVRKMRTHPTADDVYRRARRRLPAISLATVYRNLEYPRAQGWIRALGPAAGRRRYDGAAVGHVHLRCA